MTPDDLAKAAPMDHLLAEWWVQLGAEQEWSDDDLVRYATDCSAVGISPATLRALILAERDDFRARWRAVLKS